MKKDWGLFDWVLVQGTGRVLGSIGEGKIVAGPVTGSGVALPRFKAEKRTLTDRESDSASPSTGWRWWASEDSVEYHQTSPGRGVYRDGATLYKCTPTKTAALALTTSHTSRQQLKRKLQCLFSIQHR